MKDVLKRADDFIERTEKMLDDMQKDNERWSRGLQIVSHRHDYTEE